MKKLSALVGFAAATFMVAGPALAIPVAFTNGTFALAAFTTTKSNVTTTTSFAISPPAIFAGSPVGSFALVSLPLPLSATPTLNFVSLATFTFADPGFGTFIPGSATLLAFGTGGNAFATWEVDGSFLLGSDWTHAGDIAIASETWSMTQTGGTNKAISISGTFAADLRSQENVPEPATLALFGAGLAGVGAVRRRRARA